MVCYGRPSIASTTLDECLAEKRQGQSPYVRGGVTPNATFLGHSVSTNSQPSLLIDLDC